MKSGIQKYLLLESLILPFILWDPIQIIRCPEKKKNLLESRIHRSGILNLVRGIWSPHHGVQNPRLSLIILHRLSLDTILNQLLGFA